jgi:LPPG:FO 2-phospho-L-lactate transferase
VKVAALAGGIGAGKFLRGLVRAVPPEDVTVIVNTGDDLVLNGLHVSPDLDSVTYWLAGVSDRERGWGRGGESFRAFEELQRIDPEGGWFALGDLDLATHQMRTRLLAGGASLLEATEAICRSFGIASRLLPMSNQTVTTRIHTSDGEDLHFQEYWVARHARDPVAAIVYAGVDEARPAPGVLEALEDADAVVLCPSNPVVSIGPILALAGVRDALRARREAVVGVSPIVGGAPVAGMADKLMPAVGLDVTAVGAGRAYDGLLGAWVIDEADRALAAEVEGLGVKVAVTDTIMADDSVSEALARATLGLVT